MIDSSSPGRRCAADPGRARWRVPAAAGNNAGKVQLNVAGVALDDVLIVEEPLGGWRHTLFQSTRFGEIRANLMDRLTGQFEPLEQFGVPPRIWVHVVVRGQTLGMLLDLRRGERPPGAPHISDQTQALRMQDEDRGRDLAAFP